MPSRAYTHQINKWLQIVFHGTDRVSLHKHLYQPCLPECYGGTLDVPRVTGPQWYELLVTVEKEFDGTYTLYDIMGIRIWLNE